MSLREEITKYLWNGCTYPEAEIQAERVLKIFEKRIDKAKEQNLSTDVMMLRGWDMACDWIKEMLK